MSDGLKWCWCTPSAFCLHYDMCERRLLELERLKIRAAAKARLLEAQAEEPKEGASE